MASLKKEIEIGVYTALNVANITGRATGGVHLGIANDTSRAPFVVFSWQAFDEIDYTFSFGQSIEGGLLLVKSFSDENSSTSQTASGLNDEILQFCRTQLHAGITIANGSVLYLRKYADMPELQESIAGIPLTINGTLYRIKAQ